MKLVLLRHARPPRRPPRDKQVESLPAWPGWFETHAQTNASLDVCKEV
ncbi:hypothetical protein [Burkholderia ambifaria]|jgi:hypothetical protein|nr:hypothetical protein [Burkholderia ambifaria]